ncbi:centrosomal protein of 170 kDa protein B [Stigmatopora argus]
MSVTSWFLVSGSGTRHRLPKEMIFVGREDCELMLQSRSVDKQHAVINYNPTGDQHLVKDLGSLNGTFVNDSRIPDQTYVTLKVSDVLRFGYDWHVYVLEKSQHTVPEEALKHEKYTSQLQISPKPSQGKTTEAERKPAAKIPAQEVPLVVPRPTPLYGQPSWWGEDDCGTRADAPDEPPKDRPRPEAHKEDAPVPAEGPPVPQSKGAFPAYRREAGHSDVPAEDSRLLEAVEAGLQEIPTKDTPPGETPPAVQSHASFTIEFDECAPGKMKIKDHVTKFASRHGKAPPTAASSRSKVADWLVRGDLGPTAKRPPCDDVFSTKSDLAVNVSSPKGHHHDDGTQSDSEDPALQSGRGRGRRPRPTSAPAPEPDPDPEPEPEPDPEPRRRSPPGAPSSPERPSQRAFVIEFFDDNPRKKRSQSFTHNPAHADSYSALKGKLERRRGGERPASVHGHVAPVQQVAVALKGPDDDDDGGGGGDEGGGLGAPQRSASLKREDEERPGSASPVFARPHGSVGKESKLARELALEFFKDSRRLSFPGGEPTSAPAVTPRAPSPPPGRAGGEPGVRRGPSGNEEDDSVSEAGTYTIDTEAHDQEVEDARNMIDQVFGVLDSPEYGGAGPGSPRPARGRGRGRDERSDVVGRRATPRDFSPAADGAPATATGCVRAPRPEGPKWVSRWASLADGCAAPSREERPTAIRPAEVPGHDLSDSGSASRTRRLLPQVPPEKPDAAPPGEPEGRPDGDPPRQRDAARRPNLGDDPEPESLSDVGRSEDGLLSKNPRAAPKSPEGPQKSSSRAVFFIGPREHPAEADVGGTSTRVRLSSDSRAKTPPTTVLIRHLGGRERPGAGIKANRSAPDLRASRDEDGAPTKDAPARRESFTKGAPSDGVQAQRLPQIGDGRRAPDDSLSGESDVDTASTISQVSAQNAEDGGAAGPSARRKGRPPSARERLSEKRRNRSERDPARRGGAPADGRAASEASSEGPERKAPRRGQKAGSRLPKEEAQVLSRSNSLSAPRPTRASMLRRARLGEASDDNEGGETDRASQSSEPAVPPASKETKKLSRLDILALPRKRTASLAGDGESSATAAAAALSNSRRTSANEARAAAGRAAVKKTLTRARSGGAKCPNGAEVTEIAGRRTERKKSNFSSSSSDEDYKSGVGGAKRSARKDGTPAVPAETEEDGDPYQNWSTHSAEIAKLSHDLAKDLAILAREIHDVAGDGDCPGAPSPAAPPDASTSASASASASALSASEEDTQLLSPLRHLSHAIRDNTEQLAANLRTLFRDRAESWEVTEVEVKTDEELPPTGTYNQEMATVVAELRRVQKHLEVINRMVDPAANPPATLRTSAAASEEKKKKKKENGVSPKRRGRVS